MNGNDGGWPAWLTLGVGAAGIAAAFAVISWVAPLFFGCGEVSAKECSEIVRNNGLAIAGIFAGLIGLLALHFNARRTQTDRLQLTNDTYVKAIEQLASAAMEVRIGAMYALERIAHEEQRYHWPVTETLTAYIRERAPFEPSVPQDSAGEQAQQVEAEHVPESDVAEAVESDAGLIGEREGPNRAPTDIQTALTIIGQRSKRWREKRKARFAAKAAWLARRLQNAADTRRSRVPGAGKAIERLAERARRHAARTTGGEPRWVDLRHTNLQHADLRGASLERALLEGANLRDASLRDASLAGANLRDAILAGADLTGAILAGADLRDASLTGANLRDATLAGANLEGADLSLADLRDAILGGPLTAAHLKERGARWIEAFPPIGLDAEESDVS